jgi:hypothetical protein
MLQPDSRCSRTEASFVDATIAAVNSSRVSTAPSSARYAASPIAAICAAVANVRCQEPFSQ